MNITISQPFNWIATDRMFQTILNEWGEAQNRFTQDMKWVIETKIYNQEGQVIGNSIRTLSNAYYLGLTFIKITQPHQIFFHQLEGFYKEYENEGDLTYFNLDDILSIKLIIPEL